MIKKLLATSFILISVLSFSQTIRISGNMLDTAGKQALPNAVLMSIKFKDSSLVNYTRSNQDGIFKPIKLPVDTYIVIISHPNFSDRTYLLVPSETDTAFHFKNVVLPPKSVQLNEIEIIARKEKMYYKGDTLQFTADSFKVRPNATVEDLLKKLPGIRVDAAGKITIQGKAVDQVLVDGDEFFGSDPTIATRNLNANTVETIQVYDKKNETEGASDETVKVVNLKLKEDAKKGYFGKASGASDFQKFYENDFLMNKFKKDRKISLFALQANTPKQAFGWNDAYKYGINNNGNTSFDPETNSWSVNNNGSKGIPKTFKTGYYFNDKFGKNTKISSDYTFRQNQMVTGSETNTQFFLQDTNYNNKQTLGKSTNDQGHNFSLKISTKLDSLTELVVRPKVNYTNSQYSSLQNDEFITTEGETTRQTNITNTGNSQVLDASLLMKVTRNFMKKDRQLVINYTPSYYDSKTNSGLNTEFKYFKNQLPDSSLLQKRVQLSHKQEESGSVTYVEPLTKKIKTELSYGLSHSLNNNTRNTLDYNGQAYDIINALQSNDFRNTRISHRVGGKLIYEVKKYKVSLGTNYRNIYQQNVNVTQNQVLSADFSNLLPFATVNFRINQGSNLYISYNAQNTPPDLQQLQPVIDNSDPNRIRTGNPNLKPQYSNIFNCNYGFYKGISDINFYVGAYFTQNFNDITDKTTFDSLGRSLTIPVNVNGNYYGNTWMGGGFPVFKKWMKIDYGLNTSISNSNTWVNNQINSTKNYGLYPNLHFDKQNDWLEVRIGGSYNYDITRQTISIKTNQNYYSYSLDGNISLKLPKKFRISSDATYTNNGNRSPGYNINYFIVNASVSKAFLKTENLILSVDGNDILNQNISNQRVVLANKIIDTKTQVIKRYFLVRLTYKFSSQKEKKEDDDY
jgi:outer membrane receptor protein involved in Fe transport